MEERDPATTNGPISTEERTYLSDTLRSTHDALHQAVQSLTNAQQQVQPEPNRWSAVQCIEHIVLVEKGLFRAIEAAMQAPANPDGRAAIQVSDLLVVKAVRSRKTPFSAPAPFVPTGRFSDGAAAMAAFDQQRTQTIAFIDAAPDDLRHHYCQHPALGTLDVYQTLLSMAAHGERHRKQIEEIKASPGFPA